MNAKSSSNADLAAASSTLPRRRTRPIKVGLVGLLAVALIAGCTTKAPPGPWTYQGEFHQAISSADRIVVRDGGFDCCGPVDREKVLFEVTDLGEIKEIADNIRFQSPQRPLDRCLCCGFPGIDWCRGQTKLALTSVQHGTSLRWKEFATDGKRYADARLTRKSAKWIIAWLAKHGVVDPTVE